MKKSVKEAWVKALRSGEYVRCQTYLIDSMGRRCVTGVLAAVAGIEIAWNNQGFSRLAVDAIFPKGHTEEQWEREIETVWRMNDRKSGPKHNNMLSDKYTWEDIAEYIEQNVSEE